MTQKAGQRPKTLLALVVIILVGFGLRLLWLDASPLRGDEAFAIQYWAAPWPEGLQLTTVEPHPYGTFALFAAWKGVFGAGEWVMRLLPALLNVPGSAAMFVLGLLIFNSTRVALLAALLYAIHPFLIWHAQDVRNYAIWSATSAVSLAAFLAAIKHPQPRAWVRYVIFATLSAYVFFFAIFFIIAQGIYLLVTKPQHRRTGLIAMLAIGILLIPWGVQILTIMTTSEYGGTAGEFVFAQLFTWFLPTLTTGITLPAAVISWLWIVLLALYSAGLIVIWRWQRDTAVLLLILLIIPTILLWLVAGRMDVFRPRYLMPFSGYLVLVLAGILGYMTTRNKVLRVSGTLAVTGVIILNGWALLNYYGNPAYAKAPDWRSLSAFLEDNTTAEDMIIVQTVDPAFAYYYQGPAADMGMSPWNNTPVAEDIAVLDETLRNHRSIWLIPEGNAFEPFNWLIENAQTTAEYQGGGFRALELRDWQVPPDEIQTTTQHTFADVATLTGWQLDRLDVQRLRLILYWQPTTQPEQPLHGFAHLVGPTQPDTGGVLWSQDDHPVTTDHWQPTAVQRDVYILPVENDFPAGEWQLNIGLYDPATMQRVTVESTDHIAIPLPPDLIP
ncbi:glycosyltransferase family 39 protein [Chloroflexota bacterium]